MENKVVLQNLSLIMHLSCLQPFTEKGKSRPPSRHHPTPKPPREAWQITMWGKHKDSFEKHTQSIHCFCNRVQNIKRHKVLLTNWKTDYALVFLNIENHSLIRWNRNTWSKSIFVNGETLCKWAITINLKHSNTHSYHISFRLIQEGHFLRMWI